MHPQVTSIIVNHRAVQAAAEVLKQDMAKGGFSYEVGLIKVINKRSMSNLVA